jgi:HK97 family phage portal protein
MFKDFFRKTIPSNTIETKAANIDLSNMQLITGTELSTATLSPKELMAFNTHWVYTCNTKNAGTCSSIPLKLFYQNKNGSEILNSAKVTGKDDVVEILDHPFLDLIKNVNPNMNWTDLTSLIFGYMGLIGNSYVRIEKDANGKPVALYPLLSENVILKMNDANGQVLFYKYFDATFKPEEIIKFSNLQPSSLVNGKGELEACIKAVQRYCYYDSAESYLNKNNMRPDFIASFETKMTENERNDVETVFKKHFGKKGLGKPLITSKMDIKPIGLAPKEMQWIAGREAAIKEILATFGVPESLIFNNSSNYASSYTAMTHYLKYTIFPKMDKFCEKLNEQLLPLYDNNLYCSYDKTIEANQMEQATILTQYVNSGIMTVDECRERLGMQPMVINEEEVISEEPTKEEDATEESK